MTTLKLNKGLFFINKDKSQHVKKIWIAYIVNLPSL